jgi:aminomethyltransferase
MKNVYTTAGEEYQALRGGTGLVDYEGVGLFHVSGPNAPGFLGHVATRPVDFLLEGQIWPAQAEAAGAHLAATAAEFTDVEVTDVSGGSRVFGCEGPESFKVVQKFLDFPIASMAYRSFVSTTHGNVPLLVSRTGVTGEYGFKLHVPVDHAAELRGELVSLGAREAGLDAIDICRLETRFANLERESGGAAVTPFDLGLQWMVDFGRDFVGADALRERWNAQGARVPVCWQGPEGSGEVPPPGTAIGLADQPVGEVTHGTYSPTLDRVVGTARVDRAIAASGLEFTLGSTTVRTVSAPFLVATSFGVSME